MIFLSGINAAKTGIPIHAIKENRNVQTSYLNHRIPSSVMSHIS